MSHSILRNGPVEFNGQGPQECPPKKCLRREQNLVVGNLGAS